MDSRSATDPAAGCRGVLVGLGLGLVAWAALLGVALVVVAWLS